MTDISSTVTGIMKDQNEDIYVYRYINTYNGINSNYCLSTIVGYLKLSKM